MGRSGERGEDLARLTTKDFKKQSAPVSPARFFYAEASVSSRTHLRCVRDDTEVNQYPLVLRFQIQQRRGVVAGHRLDLGIGELQVEQVTDDLAIAIDRARCVF